MIWFENPSEREYGSIDFLLGIVNNNRPHMKKSKGKHFTVELEQPEMSVRPLMTQTESVPSFVLPPLSFVPSSMFFAAAALRR